MVDPSWLCVVQFRFFCKLKGRIWITDFEKTLDFFIICFRIGNDVDIGEYGVIDE